MHLPIAGSGFPRACYRQMHGRVDIFFNYDVLCIIKVCPLSCAVNVGVVSGAWAGPKNVLLSCDLSTLLPIFLETPLAEGEQRG